MEYPKRLTAINPVTGALIKSRGDNQETYSNGWEAIWGKKQDTVELNQCDGCRCGWPLMVSNWGYSFHKDPEGQNNISCSAHLYK